MHCPCRSCSSNPGLIGRPLDHVPRQGKVQRRAEREASVGEARRSRCSVAELRAWLAGRHTAAARPYFCICPTSRREGSRYCGPGSAGVAPDPNLRIDPRRAFCSRRARRPSLAEAGLQRGPNGHGGKILRAGGGTRHVRRLLARTFVCLDRSLRPQRRGWRIALTKLKCFVHIVLARWQYYLQEPSFRRPGLRAKEAQANALKDRDRDNDHRKETA